MGNGKEQVTKWEETRTEPVEIAVIACDGFLEMAA